MLANLLRESMAGSLTAALGGRHHVQLAVTARHKPYTAQGMLLALALLRTYAATEQQATRCLPAVSFPEGTAYASGSLSVP